MKIVFRNLNSTGNTISLPFQKVEVERYSWSMYGGPDTAYLTGELSADRWELIKLLRCPVEIYGDDGRLNWYGYVNKVTVPYGDMRIGLGLDNMFNSVAVSYSKLDAGNSVATEQVITSWNTDVVSSGEYGTKQKLLSIGNSNATQAGYVRDNYLASYKYAPPELELSGGDASVKIECYGWFKTLDWMYYSNSSNSNVSTTDQITDMVYNAGQFFYDIVIDNASGITSNEYRDGKATGLYYVTELLNAGTSNNQPLLAIVNMVGHRVWMHVYERVAETTEFIMRPDGNLESLIGTLEPPSHCICAKWVRIKDVPNTLGGLSPMRNFFIGSSEYTAADNKTIYKPAGSFEAVRLARWLGTRPPGGGGGGDGGGGGITPPEIPPIEIPPPIPPSLGGPVSGAAKIVGGTIHNSFGNLPMSSLSFDTIGLTLGSDNFQIPTGMGGWYLINTVFDMTMTYNASGDLGVNVVDLSSDMGWDHKVWFPYFPSGTSTVNLLSNAVRVLQLSESTSYHVHLDTYGSGGGDCDVTLSSVSLLRIG